MDNRGCINLSISEARTCESGPGWETCLLPLITGKSSAHNACNMVLLLQQAIMVGFLTKTCLWCPLPGQKGCKTAGRRHSAQGKQASGEGEEHGSFTKALCSNQNVSINGNIGKHTSTWTVQECGWAREQNEHSVHLIIVTAACQFTERCDDDGAGLF